MDPLLSASTSLIMSCSSDSEGFCPKERMTVPSSLVVIWPAKSRLLVSCPFLRHKNSQSVKFRSVSQVQVLQQWFAQIGGDGEEGKEEYRVTSHYVPSPSLSCSHQISTQIAYRFVAKDDLETYKEREGLLELRDLLFGKRISLSRGRWLATQKLLKIGGAAFNGRGVATMDTVR